MMKILGGFFAGVVVLVLVGMQMMPKMMFSEIESPYGLEETVARIQYNIENNPTLKANGWSLSGLRNPAKAVQTDGGNVLPVLMIEVCSTKYSAPVLNDDDVRFLSILMPCKVSVYKKQNGKIYIGTMNAGLMGQMFGPMVGEVMGHVADDQKLFLVFDSKMPAPQMVLPKAAPTGGAGGGGGGC